MHAFPWYMDMVVGFLVLVTSVKFWIATIALAAIIYLTARKK